MATTQNKKIVVFGADVVAELADFYFHEHTPYQVASFVVDDKYVKESSFCGKPLSPLSCLEKDFPPSDYSAFVALGYTHMNLAREEKFNLLTSLGYELVSYVSPKATVLNKEIGKNCFILEDNTIQPFVRIGNNVTLWSGNHIGHHSVIEDHCFLTSHVVVSGGVHIGARSFIGVNATLRDAISIGQDTMIGAGALVTKNLEKGSVLRAPKSELKSFGSEKIRSI